MKKIMRGTLFTAAVLFAAAAVPTEAWAATKIDEVRLEINVDGDLKAGETISNDVLDVSTNDDEYYIIDSRFLNSGDTWRRGDTPLVVVDLSSINDDYYFSKNSESYFSLSGNRRPAYSDADRYDDNRSMELIVSLRRINTGTNADNGSDEIWWDGNEACWDEVPDARGYEIRLYRDGSLVSTVRVDDEDTSYDFTGKMTRRGDYSFRVRAKYSSNSYSSWSDFSEENYVSSSDADDNADADDNGSGPGSSGSSSKGPGSSGSGSTLPSSGWMLNTYGWWYRFSDGSNPANSWQNINHSWYFFASSGYMHTGWLNWNNQWYYLKPSSGAMVFSGWYPINGKWYYFSDSGVMQTGWLKLNNIWYYLLPDGSMATGWNNVNEVWYFMDAGGAMYANAWTPDGHYVDGSGARIQ